MKLSIQLLQSLNLFRNSGLFQSRKTISDFLSSNLQLIFKKLAHKKSTAEEQEIGSMPFLPILLVSVSRMTSSASPVASDWAPLYPQKTDVCVAPLSTPTLHACHGLPSNHLKVHETHHIKCNEVIRDASETAQIPVTLESTSLLRDDGRRPDGTTLTPWQRGTSIAYRDIQYLLRKTRRPSHRQHSRG